MSPSVKTTSEKGTSKTLRVHVQKKQTGSVYRPKEVPTTLEENTGELQEYVNEKSMKEIDGNIVMPKRTVLRRRSWFGVKKPTPD